jgi:hypothetical protein
MSAASVLILAAAAGLNPWLVWLMVAGLAAFTNRVPLVPDGHWLGSYGAVFALAALLGVEIVGLKVGRAARGVWWLDSVASPVAGALLCLALANPLLAAGPAAAAAAGALAALVLRVGLRLLGRRLNAPLRPLGRVAAGMAANVVGAILVAGVFALER